MTCVNYGCCAETLLQRYADRGQTWADCGPAHASLSHKGSEGGDELQGQPLVFGLARGNIDLLPVLDETLDVLREVIGQAQHRFIIFLRAVALLVAVVA